MSESVLDDLPPDGLGELPPSCKMVYNALVLLDVADAQATQQSIAELCGYGEDKRTVRYALRRLDEADLVQSAPDVTDARQDVYERLD
jgi:repressor of nif and glnA expression